MLAYDENHTVPMNVDVYVDGMTFVDPYLPLHWQSRPHNVIEVPDADLEFMHIKHVPHGAVSQQIYWSDVLNSWERCMV